MDNETIDPVASVVSGHAEAVLRDLLLLAERGLDPRAFAEVVTLGGWKVRLEVSPAPPEDLVPNLNPCGRAVLSLLWDADSPLSAERVREALEAKGLGIFGLITVKRALRCLHRDHKAIAHSRFRPRGYYLPQRLPLFRVRPRPESAEDAGADTQLDT